MPHLFNNKNGKTIETIIGAALVRNGQCVVLVQEYSDVGLTSNWKQGDAITATKFPAKPQ
jgi:hypothetical protein